MYCNRLRLDWQYEIRKWRIWWNTKCVHYIFHEKSRKITARAAKIGIFRENSRTAVVWNSLSSVKIMKKKCRFPCKNHRVKMQFVGCRENVHIICYIIRCKEWSVCMSAGHKSEPTEMPFGLWTLVGPGNYVLDGPWWEPELYLQGKGQFSGWMC